MADDDRTNALRTRRLAKLVTDINIAEAGLNRTYESSKVTIDFMDTNLKQFMAGYGLTTSQSVREWAKKDLNGAQRQTFDKLVEFNSKFDDVGDINDTVMTITCLLAGFVIGSSHANDANFANFTHVIAMLRITQVYVKGFNLLATGDFRVANDFLQKARTAFRQTYAKDFGRTSRFGNLIGTIAQFVQFSGTIGKTVNQHQDDIAKISDRTEKAKALVKAIHETQVSRLSLGYFEVESTSLFAIVAGLSTWMQKRAYNLPGWDTEAISQAKSVAFVHDTPGTTLPVLQESLRKADGADFYKADDLSDGEVIDRAVIDIKGAGMRN